MPDEYNDILRLFKFIQNPEKYPLGIDVLDNMLKLDLERIEIPDERKAVSSFRLKALDPSSASNLFAQLDSLQEFRLFSNFIKNLQSNPKQFVDAILTKMLKLDLPSPESKIVFDTLIAYASPKFQDSELVTGWKKHFEPSMHEVIFQSLNREDIWQIQKFVMDAFAYEPKVFISYLETLIQKGVSTEDILKSGILQNLISLRISDLDSEDFKSFRELLLQSEGLKDLCNQARECLIENVGGRVIGQFNLLGENIVHIGKDVSKMRRLRVGEPILPSSSLKFDPKLFELFSYPYLHFFLKQKNAEAIELMSILSIEEMNALLMDIHHDAKDSFREFISHQISAEKTVAMFKAHHWIICHFLTSRQLKKISRQQHQAIMSEIDNIKIDENLWKLSRIARTLDESFLIAKRVLELYLITSINERSTERYLVGFMPVLNAKSQELIQKFKVSIPADRALEFIDIQLIQDNWNFLLTQYNRLKNIYPLPNVQDNIFPADKYQFNVYLIMTQYQRQGQAFDIHEMLNLIYPPPDKREDERLRTLEQILKKTPDCPEALKALCNSYMEKNLEEVLKTFRELIPKDRPLEVSDIQLIQDNWNSLLTQYTFLRKILPPEILQGKNFPTDKYQFNAYLIMTQYQRLGQTFDIHEMLNLIYPTPNTKEVQRFKTIEQILKNTPDCPEVLKTLTAAYMDRNLEKVFQSFRALISQDRPLELSDIQFIQEKWKTLQSEYEKNISYFPLNHAIPANDFPKSIPELNAQLIWEQHQRLGTYFNPNRDVIQLLKLKDNDGIQSIIILLNQHPDFPKDLIKTLLSMILKHTKKEGFNNFILNQKSGIPLYILEYLSMHAEEKKLTNAQLAIYELMIKLNEPIENFTIFSDEQKTKFQIYMLLDTIQHDLMQRRVARKNLSYHFPKYHIMDEFKSFLVKHSADLITQHRDELLGLIGATCYLSQNLGFASIFKTPSSYRLFVDCCRKNKFPIPKELPALNEFDDIYKILRELEIRNNMRNRL